MTAILFDQGHGLVRRELPPGSRVLLQIANEHGFTLEDPRDALPISVPELRGLETELPFEPTPAPAKRRKAAA